MGEVVPLCVCVSVHKVLCFAGLTLRISPVIWGEITTFVKASVIIVFSSFLNFKDNQLESAGEHCGGECRCVYLMSISW